MLVNDGARDTEVKLDGRMITVRRAGGILACQLFSPPNVPLKLDDQRVACHNGWMRAAIGELPKGVREMHLKIRLSPDDAR